MLLSALSFLVVAQSSSEVPEGIMNNPVYFGPNVAVEGVVSATDVIWCRTGRWLFYSYDTSLKGLSKTVAIPIRIGYLPNRQALNVRIRLTKLCL